jgi:hypothetical protein
MIENQSGAAPRADRKDEHGHRSVQTETFPQFAPLKVETRPVLPQSVGVIGDLFPFAGTIEEETAGR